MPATEWQLSGQEARYSQGVVELLDTFLGLEMSDVSGQLGVDNAGLDERDAGGPAAAMTLSRSVTSAWMAVEPLPSSSASAVCGPGGARAAPRGTRLLPGRGRLPRRCRMMLR
jgi:hypothetical protein